MATTEMMPVIEHQLEVLQLQQQITGYQSSQHLMQTQIAYALGLLAISQVDEARKVLRGLLPGNLQTGKL